MKRNTTVYTLGAKLFSFFLCGVCVLFLALLMLNGALQKAQMFLVAACVLAVAGYYVWNVNFRQVGSVDASTKRISTPYTLANKLFPFLFGGFCAFFFIFLLMSRLLQKAPLFLVVPGVIAVAGYYSWKKNFRDLMDEVDDCGDYLLVKKRGEVDTVPFSHIVNVKFSTLRRGEQPRIHLTLASPGKFGTEISFAPLPSIFFPRRNEIAEDLLARAAQTRSAQAG